MRFLILAILVTTALLATPPKLASSLTQQQLAKLTASDAAANDLLGVSVAISGDTVVVGSYQDASW